MAEETDDSASGLASDVSLASRIALDAASAGEAREYLRKQNRLADLQIDTLEKKDEFELSHLRFRRFSDYARFALELSVGFVVLLIVLGLATMVWNASQDKALVVDAISVPPDIAQTGMTGTALANRLLDGFAIVSARSPHIPFADSDWGMMLMRKGDLDGAIAKFASAHQKGPHFADPLEMWGEALIAKNRSDLAFAKFEEAAKYAPNWGRLHLKWGEARLWSGDKDGARKQFALAGGLDLTPSEKSELTRVSHG
jgi:tetratricopeptide (TPR) repeat protein